MLMDAALYIQYCNTKTEKEDRERGMAGGRDRERYTHMHKKEQECLKYYEKHTFWGADLKPTKQQRRKHTHKRRTVHDGVK